MEPRPQVDVTGPKGPVLRRGDELIRWAREQLVIADQIVDNPGGGLLFAAQAMGQVRASLEESDTDRWKAVIAALERAEDAAVHRDYETARQHLAAARQALG